MTVEDLVKSIEKSGRKINEGKSMMKHYGALKRGYDGLEYQKIARYGEWN
jgi:hypothetical protein